MMFIILCGKANLYFWYNLLLLYISFRIIMLDKALNTPIDACDNCAFYAKMVDEDQKPFLDNHKKLAIRSNDYLFKQGQLAMGIFCVESGALVTLKQGQSKTAVLNIIKPGHILGTNAITSTLYQHSVKGLTDAKVCFIPKPSVIKLMNQNLHFKLTVMKALCQEIEVAQQKGLSMIYKSGKQRVAALLLEVWQAAIAKHSNNTQVYFLPEEFASLAGISVKSLTKNLQEFGQKNWIQYNANHIQIMDRQSLENLL